MSDTDSLSSSRVDVNNPQLLTVKHLTPKRWKSYMLNVLQEMSLSETSKKILVTDLTTIISSIDQANFIQAALQIRPFKLEFVEESRFLRKQVTESTVAQTIAKNAKFKENPSKKFQKFQLRQCITEKTLIKQFNKQYHPYRLIIKNFARLLELKYKHFIDLGKLKVSQVQQKLREDLNLFIEFMKRSAQPYKKLFKNQANQIQQKSIIKLYKLIDTYILQNKKLNASLHKIIQYAVRHQYEGYFNEKIENFVTPQQFDLGEEYRIDGCYIRSINTLIEMAHSSDHQQTMEKLLQFRTNILKDIDQYYLNSTGTYKQLQICAQVQIQIIRFIVAKLKIWACEIYTQLKYLQLIYGQQQIAFKYQQVSFMYTQLILTFEIMQVN